MRKAVFLFCLMASLTVGAQSLKSAGGSVKYLVPEGWRVSETTGDLNKDGLKDLVMVATSNDKAHIVVRESDGYEYNFNQPVMAIYWGTADGGYRLYREYPAIMPRDEDTNVSWDVTVTVSDKGVLRIATCAFASAGSWTNEHEAFIFRYQKGDFFLIGYDYNSFARNTGEGRTDSYNFVTHKKQVQKYNEFDSTVPVVEQWSKIKVKPLRRLGTFALFDFKP